MSFEQQIARFLDKVPTLDPSVFVAPGAWIFGDVEIAEECSIWPGASIRGDVDAIRIGAQSNIQDGAVVHVADNHPTHIGRLVTVGHCAIVHACTVENEVLIGMNAVVLDGARIGARSIIGANATVTSGTIIPPGSLVLGSPAKVKKTLSPEEQASIKVWAQRYVTLSRAYLHKKPQPARQAELSPED